MEKRIITKKLNDRTARLYKAWKANRDFRLQDLTFEEYEQLHDDLAKLTQAKAQKKREFTETRNLLAQMQRRMAMVNTRVQGGFRSFYGPESPQFLQASGMLPVEGEAPPAPPMA